MSSTAPHTGAAVPAQSVALSKLLTHVSQAVQAIRAGQSGAAVLADVPHAVRPGVQALLFQVLRNLGRAQALRALLAPKAPPAKVDALLCTALALAWDSERAPYTPFTLVNQAVEAAKRGIAPKQSGFVNACLRRFLRERDDLVAQTDGDLQAQWNHPLWWIERLQKEYPEHWQQILHANNAQAPMALRVHAKKTDPERYLKALAAMGLEGERFGEFGIQLHKAQPVDVLPGFAQGEASVQDGAAQLAAPLLLRGIAEGAEPLQVLDACAAPGGKTAHLLEFAPMPLAVTALEVDPQRALRIHDTLDRVGVSAKVLVADAGQPAQWWQKANGGQLFDAILLDAPCTASGIVRRHPDVRWLRRASDVQQLAAIQSQLLDTMWSLLKPGGRMLYCTCSVFRTEGDAQVKAFVARNTNAVHLPSPGHLIPGATAQASGLPDNGAGDHDGFFYALFTKAL